jgi:hypothetical protein
MRKGFLFYLNMPAFVLALLQRSVQPYIFERPTGTRQVHILHASTQAVIEQVKSKT